MVELKQTFREFIFSTNTDGSGKGLAEIANQWKDDAE